MNYYLTIHFVWLVGESIICISSNKCISNYNFSLFLKLLLKSNKMELSVYFSSKFVSARNNISAWNPPIHFLFSLKIELFLHSWHWYFVSKSFWNYSRHSLSGESEVGCSALFWHKWFSHPEPPISEISEFTGKTNHQKIKN